MVFTLSNGETFEDKHDYSDRRYLRVLVERIKEDGTTLLAMSDEVKGMPDKRATDTLNMINRTTNERYSVTDTYLLAENERFKEYPTIDTYLEGGFASNCDYYHKVELHFVLENYQRKIYLDWRGNQSFISFLDDLKWTLEDAVENDELIDQGIQYERESDTIQLFLWTEDGNVVNTEMDLNEWAASVAGVRIVEFSETIRKSNN